MFETNDISFVKFDLNGKLHGAVLRVEFHTSTRTMIFKVNRFHHGQTCTEKEFLVQMPLILHVPNDQMISALVLNQICAEVSKNQMTLRNHALVDSFTIV